MKKGESTGKDVALFLEDVKGQMDAEASGSGLTEYHKWKTPIGGDTIGFVGLQNFGYVGPSKHLPLYPFYKSYLFMITNNPRVSLLENTFFFYYAGPRFLINWLQDFIVYEEDEEEPLPPSRSTERLFYSVITHSIVNRLSLWCQTPIVENDISETLPPLCLFAYRSSLHSQLYHFLTHSLCQETL